MIFLLLSIACSTGVLFIFRGMRGSRVNTRHSITTSYLVASSFGFLMFQPGLSMFTAPWFWFAVLEGLAFYLVFRLMAKTTQVNGMSVAGIATKMSVVIPIGIGIFVLQESSNSLKLLGVFSGICAVIISAGQDLRLKNAMWPLLVFVGTGIIDASFKLFQVWGVAETEFASLITTIFAAAFLVGLLHHLFCADRRIKVVSLANGAILGVTNFGTIYFLLYALAQTGWESSTVYPLNNFGVVIVSTFIAITLFGESLNRKGWIGLCLAVMSIGLLFLGS